MCTAVTVNFNKTYFGRNMDLDYDFEPSVIIVPRNYEITLKTENPIASHYAILGIGIVKNNYPLFADAVNEIGLGIAALSFKFNAKYYPFDPMKLNLATYELFLYLLGTCSDIDDVKESLSIINILDEDFSHSVKLTPLHFLISDEKSSIVVETTESGMHIYDNPYNVLTNNPPFNYQLELLSSYNSLTNNSLDPALLKTRNKFFSYGTGALGLPGDYSSSSRIIKANFVRQHLVESKEDSKNVNSFFSVLDSVKMPYGIVKTSNGYEYTKYSSCYDLSDHILYYKTFNNPNIKKVELYHYDVNSSHLISIPIA
jgi:choloylglycine hydrolase